MKERGKEKRKSQDECVKVGQECTGVEGGRVEGECKHGKTRVRKTEDV